jgi:hypothetical protein
MKLWMAMIRLWCKGWNFGANNVVKTGIYSEIDL